MIAKQAITACLCLLFILTGAGQGLDMNYRLGGMGNNAEVIYHTEISSTIPTWINWTCGLEQAQASMKIRPKEKDFTYMIWIVKVKV